MPSRRISRDLDLGHELRYGPLRRSVDAVYTKCGVNVSVLEQAKRQQTLTEKVEVQ